MPNPCWKEEPEVVEDHLSLMLDDYQSEQDMLAGQEVTGLPDEVTIVGQS